MKLLIRVTLIAVLLTSAGCSLLGKKGESPTVYAPRLHTTAPAQAPTLLDFQLLVDVPQASATLDSNRIAVMPTPGILQVYKGAHWADRTPALLRSLLLEAFEQSGRIAGVGGFATGLRADYSLTWQLQDFQAEYRDGVPVAVMRFSAKLVDALSGQVVAARSFSTEQAADSTSIKSVVHAFEAALDALLPQFVDWTLSEGARAHAAAKDAAAGNAAGVAAKIVDPQPATH